MTEPVITLKHFFERVRDGALTAIKCGACGELAIPPKEFCAGCGQRAWEPVPLYAIINFSAEKWSECQERFPFLCRF